MLACYVAVLLFAETIQQLQVEDTPVSSSDPPVIHCVGDDKDREAAVVSHQPPPYVVMILHLPSYTAPPPCQPPC